MPVLRLPARILGISATSATLLLALFASGCGHKTMRTTPTALVPSIETESASQPPQAAPEPANVSPQPQPAAQNAKPQKPTPKPRKPVPPPRRPPQQPTQEAARPAPAKPVENPGSNAGGNNSVQITADVPRAAVQSQRQNTEALLHASDDKLTRINRNLSDGERSMVRQARNYIAQSSQALQAGDTERAYNLAVKASLLANELAK